MHPSRRSVIARLAVANASRVLICVYVGLAFWAVVPTVLGNHFTVVMSGSMEPSVSTGDFVVVAAINGAAVRAGQVALFDDPEQAGRLRLHRVKHVEDGVFTTQGDANDVEDSSTITAEAIHGIGILRVPWIGLPVQQMKMGNLRPLVLNVLLFLACLLGTRADIRLLRHAATSDQSGPDDGHAEPEARADNRQTAGIRNDSDEDGGN